MVNRVSGSSVREQHLHGSRREYTGPEQCFGRKHAGKGLEGASKRFWTAQRKNSGTHQAVRLAQDESRRRATLAHAIAGSRMRSEGDETKKTATQHRRQLEPNG